MWITWAENQVNSSFTRAQPVKVKIQITIRCKSGGIRAPTAHVIYATSPSDHYKTQDALQRSVQ
jgi:hypothetical protein